MTIDKETILRLAREADPGFGGTGPMSESICGISKIERFATAILAHRAESGVEPVAWVDTFGNVFSDKSVTEEMQCGLDPLYTATAIAAARVAENERIVKLCKKRWKGGYPQEVIDDLVTAIHALLGKEQA